MTTCFLFVCLFVFFGGLSLWGEGGSKYHISAPSSARQRNAIQMAFRWIADEGPALNSGLVAEIRPSIAKKLYIFVIFQRRSGSPVPTSGPAHGPQLRSSAAKSPPQCSS